MGQANRSLKTAFKGCSPSMEKHNIQTYETQTTTYDNTTCDIFTTWSNQEGAKWIIHICFRANVVPSLLK